MARLIHLGGAVMDYVYHLPRLPDPGDDITATHFARLPGGTVNAMVAARHTGLATVCGGRMGTGPDADALRAFLAAEGIEALLPALPGLDCGNCVVMITPDAERSFASFPGAEAHAGDLSPLNAQLRAGDMLAVNGYVLSYPGSREAVLSLVENAPEGVTTIFDPTPVIAEVPDDALSRILARTKWLSTNMAELAVMASGPARDLIADRMPSARGIVLRDGAAGARLILRDGTETAVPGFAVAATDTNGAGDTHLGAFLGALAREMPPARALRYANAAAAICTTRPGGASGPSHDEIMRFLRDREGQDRPPAGDDVPPQITQATRSD